jgi:L-aspartate oxidase
VTSTTAVDLITPSHHAPDPLDHYLPERVVGVYAYIHKDRRVVRILCRAVVLATGGAGRIFRFSTNPPGATGDGYAMAYRAGARLIHMEYVQFHPTAHRLPSGQVLLITEAMRGEGAVLRTPEGETFMERYHPDGSLAPRDVVARAIHEEMVNHGYPYVLLDIASARTPGEIRQRFPYIHRVLLEEEGLDITREPIPVVPMAHFFCGGVKTDLWGRSTLSGLYAVGEVACNGLHGANRLASTSLLEGLVFGIRTAQAIQDDLPALSPFPSTRIPPWQMTGEEEPDPALVHQDWRTLQWIMWNYVGVVRTGERLARAVRDLRHLWFEVEHFYRHTLLHPRLVELRNGIQTGLLVARSALRNRTSRGVHFRKDAPL